MLFPTSTTSVGPETLEKTPTTEPTLRLQMCYLQPQRDFLAKLLQPPNLLPFPSPLWRFYNFPALVKPRVTGLIDAGRHPLTTSALTPSRPLPCLSGVSSPIQSSFDLRALALILALSPGARYLSVPLSPVLSAASQLASPQRIKSHSDFKRIHMSSPSLYAFPTLVFQPSFFKKRV